jgi:predicted nucleic acid-binding protein
MLATNACSVVVDTGVFGAGVVHTDAPLVHAKVHANRTLLTGEAIGVSFATVAELQFGARCRGWGRARTTRLADLIDRAAVLWRCCSVCRW